MPAGSPARQRCSSDTWPPGNGRSATAEGERPAHDRTRARLVVRAAHITRPDSKGRRAAGQSLAASPGTPLSRGRSPRQADRVRGRRTRALAVWGSCGLWPSCPPREWLQRRAPVFGGDKDQGPCGSRPGGVVPPGPQVPLTTAVRGGGACGLRARLPRSGPNRQQPSPPAGAGGAPAAGSAKAAVTTGPPGLRQTLIWSATRRTSHSP